MPLSTLIYLIAALSTSFIAQISVIPTIFFGATDIPRASSLNNTIKLALLTSTYGFVYGILEMLLITAGQLYRSPADLGLNSSMILLIGRVWRAGQQQLDLIAQVVVLCAWAGVGTMIAGVIVVSLVEMAHRRRE